MLRRNLVRNLRALRKKKKLSQGDVARGAGITTSFVSEIERDHKEPSLTTVEGLAKALGVSPIALLSKGSEA